MLPRILAMTAVLLAFVAPATRAEPDEGSRVYQETLPSVVWIYSPRGGGKAATGSGSLIDKDRRLVLTNYHVVADKDSATVVFPVFRGGKLVAERDFYRERLRTGGIKGKVVARDKNVDLALIQLDELPSTAKALPLADDSPSPGQSVQSIGNPGDSGALWVYTPGKVRQVYQKKWKAKVDDETLEFRAKVVETDSATNPGDSGGPLVNDKVQLVGVTQGGSVEARLLSTFVDVSEVKNFLNRRDVKAIPGGGERPDPVKPKDPLRDDANFFGADAAQKANKELRELSKKVGKDIVVETFPSVPGEQKEKVAAMSKEERNAFFQKWAHDRMQAEKINGVYILICKQPSNLQVRASESVQGKFNNEAVNELVKQLLKDFGEKKYDEGLENAIKYIRRKFE